MKIIIMSATLPKLDMLTGNHEKVVNLIENPENIFRTHVLRKEWHCRMNCFIRIKRLK